MNVKEHITNILGMIAVVMLIVSQGVFVYVLLYHVFDCGLSQVSCIQMGVLTSVMFAVGGVIWWQFGGGKELAEKWEKLDTNKSEQWGEE